MKNKLGHQAPKKFRVNKFNSIEIDGDLRYCESHNFLYNKDEQEFLLYQGKPCYFTDNRFYDGNGNFYKNCYIKNSKKDLSLKSCIRKILSCKNIPVGTIVKFNKNWYYPDHRKINGSYKFKIRKENKLDINYEISDPTLFANFSTCERSQKLCNELRNNGFLVKVYKNTLSYTKTSEYIDTKINGEIAIAYGYGKMIGFSSYDDDFQGYSYGIKSILWDRFGQFDKWSKCNEIDKNTDIDEIIKELKN